MARLSEPVILYLDVFQLEFPHIDRIAVALAVSQQLRGSRLARILCELLQYRLVKRLHAVFELCIGYRAVFSQSLEGVFERLAKGGLSVGDRVLLLHLNNIQNKRESDGKKEEGDTGFEPVTCRSAVDCSTPELTARYECLVSQISY